MQVFDSNGRYETQWNNLHRPCALCRCGGKSPTFVIGELGPGMAVNRKVPNLGPRVSIVDAKGKRIARLGDENGPGIASGKFLAPHGIALDSRGDMYVGEVGVTDWKTNFPDEEMPAVVHRYSQPQNSSCSNWIVVGCVRRQRPSCCSSLCSGIFLDWRPSKRRSRFCDARESVGCA